MTEDGYYFLTSEGSAGKLSKHIQTLIKVQTYIIAFHEKGMTPSLQPFSEQLNPKKDPIAQRITGIMTPVIIFNYFNALIEGREAACSSLAGLLGEAGRPVASIASQNARCFN